MIKIDVEFETEYGIFRDAIYLSEGHKLTEKQIQAMKEERRDNWIKTITSDSDESIDSKTSIADDSVIEVLGEQYKKLEDVPKSGAKLIEINNVWYYKV